MPAYTPKFDTAIAEILKELKPQDKVCRECGMIFHILQEDIDSYNLFEVPPPKSCPNCRLQRQLGFRSNFLPTFYKRRCNAPGHDEQIISYYSAQNPVVVYDDKYYFSDKWDALDFGRKYDESMPFFKQFQQLEQVVPHEALQRYLNNVDCDYVVSGTSSRNCYYVAIPLHSENIYYAHLTRYAKDSIDLESVDNSENCYSSANLEGCYNCNFCYDSSQCVDSWFLFDCYNCADCFNCVNLRNKKYCISNRQLSEEEYRRQLAALRLSQRSALKKQEAAFQELVVSAIRKNLNNLKIENSIGDGLRSCKNCYMCYWIHGQGERQNLRYAYSISGNSADISDLYGAIDGSSIYNSTGIVTGGRVRCSFNISNGLDLEYCAECKNCQHCFGCFGLRSKNYCILNKQYTSEEYWKIVDDIKNRMLVDGEYSEFFPMAMSPIPYNDSNAQIEFPCTKEEILQKNWKWQEEAESKTDLAGMDILEGNNLPNDISDVKDDILDKVIICSETQKPFRLTRFELEFYRRKKLPLPTIHPLERLKKLFVWRRPYRLYQYSCAKCGQNMYTSYAPEKKFRVYCVQCYQTEVI